MSQAFQDEASRFTNWIKKQALPLWADRGADPAGGFFEALDHHGNPIEGASKRARVQARQAFSFARAERLGWVASGREASDHAWRFLVDQGSQVTQAKLPAFIHRFKFDGSVEDAKVDLYDHAFVLLAATEREIAFGDPEAEQIAVRTISVIRSLASAHGGFVEGAPPVLPRRTNPHMHLFEACLLRNQNLDCDFSASVIEESMELWNRHFWDQEELVLREFFSEDWKLAPLEGGTIEPGHMMEWLFLLHSSNRLSAEQASQLFFRAREIGLTSSNNLLSDSYNTLDQTQSSGCRLWSQTEHIRSAVVMAHRTSEPWFLETAADLLRSLRTQYLEPVVEGGWLDQVDHEGSALSDRMPTSLLYHLVTAAEEVEALLNVSS